jgi:hypothetical protein
VAPSELSKDRDIIVKLGDANGIARFRTMRSAEIKKAAETARVRAANPVLAAVEFVAARQLKSGDLCLTLRSAKDAEAARVHRHKWTSHLWKGSEVRLPSWGVVIHDVNVRSLGIDRPEDLRGKQDAIIQQLLTENDHTWGKGAEITHLAWLVLPTGKSGSLIIKKQLPPRKSNF